MTGLKNMKECFIDKYHYSSIKPLANHDNVNASEFFEAITVNVLVRSFISNFWLWNQNKNLSFSNGEK